MATGAAAHADTTMISQDNTGILNGTQLFTPIQAPVNLCGVAAAVAGHAAAGCDGGSSASLKGHHDARLISHGNTGILNGTQVYAPIQAPINACGVAVGVIGGAAAGCDGGASASLDGRHHYHGKHHKKTESAPAALSTLPRTLPAVSRALPLGGLSLVDQLLGGLLHPAASDVNVDELDRYTESVRAESDSEGGQGGGKPSCGTKCPTQPPATPPAKPQPPKHHGKHHHHKDIRMITGHNTGILNGTQVYAPVQVPVDASGIALAVLGQSYAHSDGGSSARM